MSISIPSTKMKFRFSEISIIQILRQGNKFPPNEMTGLEIDGRMIAQGGFSPSQPPKMEQMASLCEGIDHKMRSPEEIFDFLFLPDVRGAPFDQWVALKMCSQQIRVESIHFFLLDPLEGWN